MLSLLLILLTLACLKWWDKILFSLLLLFLFLFLALLLSVFACSAFFALFGKEVLSGLDLEVNLRFLGSGRERLGKLVSADKK